MKSNIFCVLLFLLLVNCTENPFEADSEKVQQEYDKWKSFGIISYTMKQQTIGLRPGSAVMVKITVTNNQITNVQDTTGSINVDISQYCWYRTVEQLFQEAINIRNSKPSSFSFVYDEKYNYPLRFFIDPNKAIKMMNTAT